MENLEKLARLIRYYSLLQTSTAGSGHLTSSLSATDLMTTLFFGGFFHFDLTHPNYENNDRIIFSKGHASPLFYALWAAAGGIDRDSLLTYRKFGSPLEGHPTMEFKYTEAPTGSLGQGLSVGLGMALAGKIDSLKYKTYVLLGDGEMAEGQVWEAIEVASKYKLNNLIGIIDVNRLGQSGETMLGWDTEHYKKRIAAFGWEVIVIDGHNLKEISHAFSVAHASLDRPVMIIAKTVKGKGVKSWENKEGFHAKTIPHEKMGEAESEFGEIDKSIVGKIAEPEKLPQRFIKNTEHDFHVAEYKLGQLESTRKAFGHALVNIKPFYSSLVSLDGEVSNSTNSEIFKEKFPESFLEMYIAEQNMVSTAVGLARRGKLPFVSTFSAFFTRAHDQIRMASYAGLNIKFVGSHAGISIGPDGASQMGLEDIALFRSLAQSTVLYPSDAVSSLKLTEQAAEHHGLVYLRTTRMDLETIYSNKEEFKIGGSKILKSSAKDKVVVIGAGITVHEALKAYGELKKEAINIQVIDLYSIRPLDSATLEKAAKEIKKIIVVEDHFPEGGIFEAVASSLVNSGAKIYSLSVNKKPRSGTPEELLCYAGIDSAAICGKVKEII